MPTLYLDLETYCETPIKYGAHKYAEFIGHCIRVL